MTTNEVMQSWMKAAEMQHIKIGERVLTKEECDVALQLLRCVAADLLMCQQPAAPEPAVTPEQVRELERRVDQLEMEMLPHRRLGPKPEGPDPKAVEELVKAAKEALNGKV